MDLRTWALANIAKPCHMDTLEEREPARGKVEKWHTRAAEEEDERGPLRPVKAERIAYEDMTLMGGVPTEEVLASLERGWSWLEVAPIVKAYSARKHAPWLLESEPLPNDI